MVPFRSSTTIPPNTVAPEATPDHIDDEEHGTVPTGGEGGSDTMVSQQFWALFKVRL